MRYYRNCKRSGITCFADRDRGGHDVGDTKGNRHRTSTESHILVDIATTLGSTARDLQVCSTVYNTVNSC